jgi:hypothetical protein
MFLAVVFLLPVGHPVFVLKAILTDIVESRAITTSFGVVSMTLRVLEAISLLNGCYD